MKNYLKYLLISTAFFIPTLANSQVWSLKQCVDTALNKNLTIQQSSNSVDMRQIYVNQSKSNLLPSLNGSAGQNYNAYVENDNSLGNAFSNNFSLNSQVTIFNGFQNKNSIKKTQLELEASKLDLEYIKNEIVLNVIDVYLQVLYANELLKNSKIQVETSNSQLSRIEDFYKVGKKSQSDVLQLKSQLAGDKLSVVNAEGNLRTAKLMLQQMLNISVSPTFDIEYNLLLEPQQIENYNVAEIYEQARNYQPDIKANELKTKSEEMQVKILEGNFLPKLNLNGNISSNYSSIAMNKDLTQSTYSFPNQLGDNINGLFSLSLSIPIYNNKIHKNNVELQKINLKNSQLNEKITNDNLRKNIEQACIDAENSSSKLTATKEQLDATKASLDIAQIKYDNGMLSTSELLIEKNNFTKIQSAFVQAKFELLFRQKVLDYYKGTLQTF